MTAKETLILRVLNTEDNDRLISALRVLEGADEEPLITPAEAARRLAISMSTFRRLKPPPAAIFGGAHRYRWSDLLTFANSRKG
jgi:hypothetical protein